MTSPLFRLASSALLATLGFGIAVACPGAGAQPQASPDQKAALNAVARMMEAQRTYYQKNGAFRATVSNIQQDFGITLPASFDYAVRTTTEAAYSYVIPAQTAKVGQLNAYVGAAFLTPTQNPRITTIICMNIQPGQIRPADPQLVLGSLVANPTGRIVQCGDASVEVTASIVNE
ncbi:type IV pilin-like G/H family protein [Synechococcus sp. CCAP 1479/9]|uniref:type IV pilin-like G/H family protein n=1 Tax=Synechococcus sp. CCAP 1479/9 TaxID=1221593 RepID=UPI001C23F4EC|nr:type IV pilin-like G/H family protein [Synechococcus sp. CCAP 1479/9]